MRSTIAPRFAASVVFRHWATPERTAFVRFRRLLVAHDLDRALFDAVITQFTAKAMVAGR